MGSYVVLLEDLLTNLVACDAAAREASRRIVDDILMDAGAELESSEYSPTMVKMNEDILNDSF